MIRKFVKKHKTAMLIILTVVAAVINAFSVKTFIRELHLVPLGVPGVAIILENMLKSFGIKAPYYYIFFTINLSLLLWCYFKISKEVAYKSLLYVVIFTFVSSFLPKVYISEDKFINIMSGAICNAASSLILIYVGSSVGGFNIVGLYFSKKSNKSQIGTINNITNTVIIFTFAFVSRIETAIASLIIAIVSSIIVERYHQQSNYLLLMIVTNKPNLILEYATEGLKRTGTYFDSVGSYSRKENKTIFISISKVDYKRVLKEIKKIDEKSHTTVLKVKEISGNMKSLIDKSAI